MAFCSLKLLETNDQMKEMPTHLELEVTSQDIRTEELLIFLKKLKCGKGSGHDTIKPELKFLNEDILYKFTRSKKINQAKMSIKSFTVYSYHERQRELPVNKKHKRIKSPSIYF